MNAGVIPADHWTQDISSGGRRIIGEVCHSIDLMRFLADSPIVLVQARRMGDAGGVAITEDKATITLGFQDGSFGTILYLANGASDFPKERIEVFLSGRVLQIDNFIRLMDYGWPGFRKKNLGRQHKGKNACTAAFFHLIETGHPAISPEEIFDIASVTVKVAELLRSQ
jgi:predicted dehydrogenase